MAGTTLSRTTPAYTLILTLAIAALGVVLAVFFGQLASTGNPILVSFAVALLVGAMLIARPAWNVWLVLALGMLVVGVVPLFVEGAASRAIWGVALLGMLVMLRAWLQALAVPGTTRDTPLFVWLALGFIGYTLANSFWQFSSQDELLGGFKRYYQAIGLLFALAWLPLRDRDILAWRKFLLVVAMLQFPWALYQLVKLVPFREGVRHLYSGMFPLDVVAGTFGATLTGGGGNAEMAMFQAMMLAFLLAHLREKTLSLTKVALLFPVVAAPIFMGETKIMVAVLPLVFFTLFRRELMARPLYGLVAVVLGALLTVAAGYAYVQMTGKESFRVLMDDTLNYSVGDRGMSGHELNRGKVFTHWAGQQSVGDAAGAMLGHGLGTTEEKDNGLLARRYPGYGVGLTAASTLLWEQGALGAALFLWIVACAWSAAGRVRRAVASPPWARADAAAIQVALPVFLVSIVHGSGLVQIMPFQIVFWFSLGYLAWLWRRFVADKAPLTTR